MAIFTSSALLHNSIDFSSSQDLPAATIFSPKSILFLPKNSSAIFVEPSKSWKWTTRVSLISSFLAKNRESRSLKQELLDAIAPLDRGAAATPEDQQRVELIAQKLEAVNKVKEPLKSNLLNGKWELLYTTSKSILQNDRPKFLRPNGKIYQAINVDALRAQNMETWPFFNQGLGKKKKRVFLSCEDEFFPIPQFHSFLYIINTPSRLQLIWFP